ncbi:MAG: hypothetical protein JXD19_03310, partial [Deltaproteobacteria bacterium]|nr:hypothetical protein [Deltaproteobacteria bacterium]
NYCFSRVYGCTKHCFGYSHMIRGGQMEREEALREEEEMLAEVATDDGMRTLLLEKIGLSTKEVNRVLSLKN